MDEHVEWPKDTTINIQIHKNEVLQLIIRHFCWIFEVLHFKEVIKYNTILLETWVNNDLGKVWLKKLSNTDLVALEANGFVGGILAVLKWPISEMK